jgi:protein phosphatase
MGTTTTAMYFYKNILTIGHVGDSRCYFFRPDAVWQLTRDHSLVQEKLKAGIITREQTKTDKMKNVILRSVGFEAHMEVDFYSMTTEPQDLFLLCSDGLTGQLNDVQISNILSDIHTSSSPLYEITQRLIQAANQSGGEDNITALLVQIL